MKLFGGSENYTLQAFEVKTSSEKSIPHFSLTISKVHNTENVLVETQMEVQDSYKIEGEVIKLFLNGVGRFNIESVSYNKSMFELFKKIVTTSKYFTMKIEVTLNGWTEEGAANIVELSCSLEANERTSSFLAN